MSALKIFGIVLLGLVWAWLSRSLLIYGGGFTLKNLFIIAASAIIIFVPLWKKYDAQRNNNQ